ncbi:MAG: phosphotransferase [Proteobacteria bacterium]|nr:phosphotransferase [Pseudomonadota bacterium]
MDDPTTILQEVTPCLSHWNIKSTSIELVSHSENIVYKVTAQDGREYALRVHRPGYRTLAELKSEQIWTGALIQFGMRVPKAYPTTSGDYYVGVECGGTTRQIGLIGWLDGRPLASVIVPEGEAEFPLQLIKETGAIFAQFHNQATSWRPPPEFTRHHLNLQGFMGEEPFWGRFWDVSSLTATQRRTIVGLRKIITRRLTDYGEPPTTYSIIHADLDETNLFVTDDGLIVIDFDDAGFGWHQYDLAVVLCTQSERSDFDAIRHALVEGYRTQRDLSDEDLSLLELFVLVRTLALIGWASARPEIGRSDYLTFLIDKACRTKI